MFIVIKLIKPFLLPPTQIALGIILTLFLIVYRKFKWAKISLLIVLIFYYSLSIGPVANLLSWSLEKGVPLNVQSIKEVCNGVEAIIVLSGGTRKEGGLRPQDELSGESLERVWCGVKLYRDLGGHLPVLFSGGTGNPFGQRAALGEIAKLFFLNFGIPEAMIWIEDSSRDTYESGLAVKRILDNRFPDMKDHKVILVTSALHMQRAVKVFQKLGLDPIPAPSSYQSGRVAYHPLSFLPSIGNLFTSTIAIHEWMGIVGYRLRGRI